MPSCPGKGVKAMKMNDIRISTLGGTICSIWASISLGDVAQTALMAALGTLVSFVTSRLLSLWKPKGRK
ncbi:hypothetical protein [Sphingobacterium thalpophilum]|uniref:hypothetical protein n=1 Tax=Sphingobacterium thalpophilum TaxID=259 RepID=UPI002D77DE2E|nr:hypothetical protein [Sphingobacterium thalpophilum]